MKPQNCLFFFFFSSKIFCLRTTCVQSTLVRFKTDSFQPNSFCPKPVLYTEIASVFFDFLENPAPDFSSCTVRGECGQASRRQFQYPALRDRTCFLIKESAFLLQFCACALAAKCDGCDCWVNVAVKCWRQLHFLLLWFCSFSVCVCVFFPCSFSPFYF